MIRALQLALVACAIAACSSPQPPLSASDAWVRQPLPGKTMTAAYMTLVGSGDETVVIDRVSSPQFARVEIHTTDMTDGVMRMRRIDALRIEPGQTVMLAPGGNHLMLMQPRTALSTFNSVELSLFSGDRPLAQLTMPLAETNPYD